MPFIYATLLSFHHCSTWWEKHAHQRCTAIVETLLRVSPRSSNRVSPQPVFNISIIRVCTHRTHHTSFFCAHYIGCSIPIHSSHLPCCVLWCYTTHTDIYHCVCYTVHSLHIIFAHPPALPSHVHSCNSYIFYSCIWIYNSRYRVYTATYSIQTLINNKTPLAIIDLSGTSRYSLTHSGKHFLMSYHHTHTCYLWLV